MKLFRYWAFVILMRILVIDDDSVYFRSLEDLIVSTFSSPIVEWALNIDDGVRKISSNLYSLVFVDYQIGYDQTVIDFLESMVANGVQYRAQSLIAISAAFPKGARNDLKASGLFAHVLSKGELVEDIDRIECCAQV